MEMKFLHLFREKTSTISDRDALWDALVDLFTSEETFIAEGSGNGVLHLGYIDDLCNSVIEELPFDFMPWDWTALFKGWFSVPDEPWKDDDNYSEWRSRQLARHGEVLAEYPLLARIIGIYDDAIYAPSEIPELIEECKKVLTRDLYAIRALSKIRLAAEKANERGLGLLFSAD